ncbi:MAG: sulfur carrier protein ThiS [Candidatus Hydrogenedentes bacterium]|jgi:thiamine biosynthesis protein ThiS|nr:sulfur carrier protein ThiS [Candidatus Hydrogenedentota bacterium]
MNITLNGEARTVDAGTSLQQLLDALEVNCDALVVQRNDDIVARAQFADTPLADGDTLELVRFVGGG